MKEWLGFSKEGLHGTISASPLVLSHFFFQDFILILCLKKGAFTTNVSPSPPSKNGWMFFIFALASFSNFSPNQLASNPSAATAVIYVSKYCRTSCISSSSLCHNGV